jgi:hypothetical protein
LSKRFTLASNTQLTLDALSREKAKRQHIILAIDVIEASTSSKGFVEAEKHYSRRGNEDFRAVSHCFENDGK